MTDADIRELFDERAAICEHEGKHSRERSEWLAARHLVKLLGRDNVPDWVRAVVEAGKTVDKGR